MKELQEKLRLAWAERQPRERRFLLGLALFVALAVIAQGLWSAHGERGRLRKKIPELRQQADAMQRQAGEMRQLQAQAKAPAATVLEGAPLLAAALSAAKASGLSAAAAQLRLEGPRQIRLRAALPFDRWLEWLATLQRDVRLRLIHCQVDSGKGAGMVQIDALLALPDPV